VPFHLQPCFAYLGYAPGSLPRAERAAGTSLALPIFGELTDDQLQLVVSEVSAFVARRGARAPAGGSRSAERVTAS
jgi:dTDP-4-amino-4,6-dideoxygalactose transaminase